MINITDKIKQDKNRQYHKNTANSKTAYNRPLLVLQK